VQPVLIGAEELEKGAPGPGGTLLRLARPGEADDVARLAEMTGGPLDEYMHGAIETGSASAALISALSAGSEALLGPAARFARSGDPTPMTELSLALVAEEDGRIAGALYALPPGRFITQCIDKGLPPTHAAVTATAAIKIKALAVDPEWRGRGIATALLGGCTGLYDKLGYHLLYGSFTVGSGLGAFYSARGFDLVPPGSGISMNVFIGLESGIGADGNEQLFARWR